MIGIDDFSNCGDGLLNVMNCDVPFPIRSVRSPFPYTQISQTIKTKDLKTVKPKPTKWTLFLDSGQKELFDDGSTGCAEDKRAEAILLESDPLGCWDGTRRIGGISDSEPLHSVYRRRSLHFSPMWEHGEVGVPGGFDLAPLAPLSITLLWICSVSLLCSSSPLRIVERLIL